METAELIYKIRTASAKDIEVHLEACNDVFYPPLAQRVNIEEYAIKIFEKAVTFEAWSVTTLVGLVAGYFGDDSNHVAYITNVSVLGAFLRLGIASKLLAQCVEYATKQGVMEIRLEAYENNRSAIALYKKFDFVPDGVADGFLKMKLSTRPTEF